MFTVVLDGIFDFLDFNDPKLWYIFAAFGFGIASYLTYFYSVVKGNTSPHPISWLVWLTTQIISTVSTYIGGGGYGSAYGFFYCYTIFSILMYTVVKKSKWDEYNKADWICLVICAIGIFMWLKYDTPVIGLLMATGVDAYGYDPTIRHAYKNPWKESIWGWGLAIPNIILVLLALDQYNWLTMPYHIVMLVCNIVLVAVCVVRRRYVPKPVDSEPVMA